MRRLGGLLVLLAACGGDAEPLALTDLDGASHRPLAPGGAPTVLLFITTDCPIANAYAPEIGRLVADHPDVRFFLVHVDPDVTPDDARAHARDFDLPGPILIDTDHALVRRTGATVTPEAVVLAPDGAIAYRGRIDDWFVELGRKRPRPTKRDLRAALAAVQAGDPVANARTTPVGCLIPE